MLELKSVFFRSKSCFRRGTGFNQWENFCWVDGGGVKEFNKPSVGTSTRELEQTNLNNSNWKTNTFVVYTWLLKKPSSERHMPVLYLAWRSQHHGATSIEIKRKRKYYPALKELGLLLADWTRGILFGAWAGFFLRRQPILGKGKSKNRSEVGKSTVSPSATNRPLTKSGVL